jgi:hypothetical protein
VFGSEAGFWPSKNGQPLQQFCDNVVAVFMIFNIFNIFGKLKKIFGPQKMQVLLAPLYTFTWPNISEQNPGVSEE